MVRRFAAIALVLAGFALACRRQAVPAAPAGVTPGEQRTPGASSGLARILAPRPGLEDVQKSPLPEARERLDGLYRLQPDRRFLAGVAATKRILRGGGPSNIQLSFDSGRWSIACDGQAVGSLPEFPSYADARTLLLGWARQLGAASGGETAREAAEVEGTRRFSLAELTATLTEVDRKWNPSSPDPSLAHSAGHALTLMLFQGFDRLELTNDIAGQALAALAIAEDLGAGVQSEQALLGSILGYESEAKAIALQLRPGDPVRLYAEGKTAALKALAETHREGPFVGYLAVRSLPAAAGASAWETWVKAHFFTEERTLETLHAELEIDQFESNARCAEAVIGSWMSRLDPEWSALGGEEPSSSEGAGFVQRLLDRYVESIRERLRKKPAGLLRRFEAGLAKRASPGPGPFWSLEADRAWTRASFYSAVYLVGRFYLDELSTEEGAASYALYLQDAPVGIASEYVAWFQHLTASKRGETNVDVLAADASRGGLGYRAASRSLDQIEIAIVEQRKPVAEILSGYARQLDTRPDARYRLVSPLYNGGDPIHVLKLCRHCLELSGGPVQAWNSAWCASMLGDARSLLRVAGDPSQSLERRVESLSRLRSREGTKPDVLRALYRRLVEDSGYARPAVAGYVFFLDDMKDFGEELRVVDGYIAHNPKDDILHVIYVGRRAHCLSGLGRHAEAWKVIEPEVASQQGDVMGWAAEILSELGRTEESLALARQLVNRYPDESSSRAAAARLLWRAQRDSEAALVLGDRHAAAILAWQNQFAPAFLEAFAESDVDRVVRAFRALQEQRIPFWSLEMVPHAFGREGKAQQAFRLYEQLSGVGSYEYPWPKARAYEFLREWKGVADAQNWIVDNFSPKMIPLTGPALFSTGNYELLWILSVPGTEPSSETWLLRAGGAALEGLEHAAHRDQLLAHFRDAGSSPDLRSHVGRYVLGLETEEELLRRPRKAEDDGELAYFLGLHAFTDGRLLDAGDWLQLVPLRGKAHTYDAGDLRFKIASRIEAKGLSQQPLAR